MSFTEAKGNIVVLLGMIAGAPLNLQVLILRLKMLAIISTNVFIIRLVQIYILYPAKQRIIN